MFGKRTRRVETPPEWIEIVADPIVDKVREEADSYLQVSVSKGERRGWMHVARSPELTGQLHDASSIKLLAYSPGTGILRVHLAAGPVVEVPPLPQVEAWDVSGLTDSDLYCMPGGHVAVFPTPRGVEKVKIWFQNLFIR